MKLVAANWKLNPPTLKQAQKLVNEISKAKARAKVVLFPPVIYLPDIKTKFDLGVQDISVEDSGAFTGATSPAMVKQYGVKYAIIGHSERRALGETDEQVNLKLHAALKNKLTPILCVGFGIASGENTEHVMSDIQEQLKEDLHNIDPSKIIVAYEPVWAVGTGRPATPDHAEKVAMFIKIKFKVKKVLYGGSTNASNYQDFLEKNIDGLLVGGASLKPEQFKKMIS